MSELIVYAIPAIVFVLVGALVTLLWGAWQKHFSAESRAISSRLQEIAAHRHGDGDHLAKAIEAPSLLQRLTAVLPGAAALRLLVMRSGAKVSASDISLLSAGLGLFTALALGTFTSLHLLGVLLASLLVGLIPILVLQSKQKQRLLKFEEQLPEALDFMSRALRAGHGLTIALGMVGDEMPAPIGPEFKTAFDEINFGLPFPEAMSNLSHRINSSDLGFFVVAVMIQRETGGNLTELLGTLAKTVRERLKLHGKVRVLSAEGKFSGVLLGGLPFALGLLLTALNPDYMSALWTTPSGHKLVMVGLIMMAVGFLWMWKIVQIKV